MWMTWTRRSARSVLVTLVVFPLLLVGLPTQSASAATRSCSSSTPVSSRPTLYYKDSGSCVKVLQSLLLKRGYNIGRSTPSGYFDAATRRAVQRYQSSKLDLTIDGIVGAKTWNRLVNGGGIKYSTRSGPNRTSRVVLSYDDCPKSLSAFKAAVVGAEDLGIALVLAPTGNCISAGRFSASYARAHGHYVINHSISHPDLADLSYSQAKYQLGSPGVVTSYGRPPYGSYDFWVRNAYAMKKMRMWLWDVDTNDWRGKTQSQVVSYVVNYSHSNDTVLMHMQWNGFTKSAMSAMKKGLAAKGLGVCRNRGTTTPTKPHILNC